MKTLVKETNNPPKPEKKWVFDGPWHGKSVGFIAAQYFASTEGRSRLITCVQASSINSDVY